MVDLVPAVAPPGTEKVVNPYWNQNLTTKIEGVLTAKRNHHVF